MFLGMGQPYAFQINNFSIPTNAGAAMDIFTLTAQTGIPIYIRRMELTSNSSQAQTVPVSWAVRSTTGSGGSTTLATSVPEPPSGSSATEVFAYAVTTVGALVKTVGADFWQIFGAVVFDRKPSGLLITPGQTFALAVPTNGVLAGITASLKGEYVAVK